MKLFTCCRCRSINSGVIDGLLLSPRLPQLQGLSICLSTKAGASVIALVIRSTSGHTSITN